MKRPIFKIMAVAMALTITQSATALIADPEDPLAKAKVILDEDFSLVPAIEPWKGSRKAAFDFGTYALNPAFTHTPGWTGWYMTYGMDAGVLHFEFDDESDTGYIQTPSMDLSADGGKVTIIIEYKKDSWEGQKYNDDTIHPNLWNTATNKTITGIFNASIKVNTEWNEYSITLEGGTPDCAVRIWGGAYPGDIRRIKVLQVRPELDVPVADPFTNFTGTSFTANWRAVEGAVDYLLSVYHLDADGKPVYLFEDKVVTGTSHHIDGLDAAKVYHYTVKARSGNLISEPSTVVRCFGVSKPEAIEFSEITDHSFRVDWDDAVNANAYQLSAALRHTASHDGTYYLIDEDFLSTPNQGANPDEPVRSNTVEYLDGFISRADWLLSYGMYARDCIGLDNTFASMGMYGEIDSPIMDLSAGGGEVTVELRMRALNAASAGLYLMNINEIGRYMTASSVRLYDEYSDYPALSEQWQNYSIKLTGGTAKSFIAVQAYGYGAKVQIDRLAVSQNLKAGETVSVPFRSIVTDETYAYIDAGSERFSTDDTFDCMILAAFNPGKDDTEAFTTSEWSDVASCNVIPTALSEVAADTTGSYSVAGGIITIGNPAGADAVVATLDGKVVLATTATAAATEPLQSGIYLVRIGAITAKVLVK